MASLWALKVRSELSGLSGLSGPRPQLCPGGRKTHGQDVQSGRTVRTHSLAQDAHSGSTVRTHSPDAQSGCTVRTHSQDAQTGRTAWTLQQLCKHSAQLGKNSTTTLQQLMPLQQLRKNSAKTHASATLLPRSGPTVRAIPCKSSANTLQKLCKKLKQGPRSGTTVKAHGRYCLLLPAGCYCLRLPLPDIACASCLLEHITQSCYLIMLLDHLLDHVTRSC